MRRGTRRHPPSRIWMAASLSTLNLLLWAGEPAAPPKTPAGQGVLRQVWKGVGGNAVSDLTALDDFPGCPALSEVIPNFETPTDCADTYGTLVRGYLHPPATGEYTFWIASDDNSELWLSTGEDPKQKRKIAQVSSCTAPRGWDQFPEQKSLPIALTAGRSYYIEALQKEGIGGDNLSVGWQLPQGVQERPIPGTRLTPFAAPPAGPRQPRPQPNTHGFHKLKFQAMAGVDKIELPFLVYLPKKYETTCEKVPVLFFFHGAGECGADLEAVYKYSPSGKLRANPKAQETFSFALVSPQCLPGRRWDTPGQMAAVSQLLDHLLRNFRFDPERVYGTGLSMGGKGTWLFGFEAANRLAAIAPISAVEVFPEKALERLGRMGIWITVGGADGAFTEGSRKMYEALKTSQREVRYTEIPNLGHADWDRYYPNPEFYQWLLKHTRQGPDATFNPAASAKAEAEVVSISLATPAADPKTQQAKAKPVAKPKAQPAKRPASKPAAKAKAPGPSTAKAANPGTPKSSALPGKPPEAAKDPAPPPSNQREAAPDRQEGAADEPLEEPADAESPENGKSSLAMLWTDSGPSQAYSLSLTAAGILLAAAFVFILQTGRGGKS